MPTDGRKTKRTTKDKIMILTTLCYIEKDDSYLMLHRVKKNVDVNKGKWIGVGGKFEAGESPDECLKREVREETGLELTSYRMRGVLTFQSVGWETEYIFLYTADGFTGEVKDCNEGILKWVRKDEIKDLNLWRGDRVFLKLLKEEEPFFSMKLSYVGDDLIELCLNGEKITPKE